MRRLCKKIIVTLFKYFFILFVVVPVIVILLLRYIDPITSSVILQHKYHAWKNDDAPVHSFHWTSYHDVSQAVPLAYLASEDQRFPTHHGIDFVELRKALSTTKPRGASTISQQVVKNLFLWQGRSYFRKLLEAYLTLLIEILWPKQRILEIYINIAQTGPRFYGIAHAANDYFNKSPTKLNLYEAARIAAVLPNPNIYSVTNPSAYVLAKQKHILEQIRRLGGYGFLKKINVHE